MGRTSFALTLAAAFVAQPAIAHPGHGVPGWSHHADLLVFGVMVLGALVALAARVLRPVHAARRRVETR